MSQNRLEINVLLCKKIQNLSQCNKHNDINMSEISHFMAK